MKLIKFIGYGELTWDQNYDSLLNLIKENGGGTTWNILSNIASFGSKDNTMAIGVVGNDNYGKRAINALRERGINVQYLQEKNKPTNMVFSIIPDKITGDQDIKYSMISPVTNKGTYKFYENLSSEVPESLNDFFNIIIIENFRSQNIEFIKHCKEKKVVMDIGRKKILEGYDKEYLIDFLNNIDVCQISMEVLKDLYSKLQINSTKELVSIINPELLIITNGKNNTTFIYNTENGYTWKRKKPAPVNDIVDTTGAGDCFFSVIINAYGRYCGNNKNIDEEFIDTVFPLASGLSAEVIRQIGGRCDLSTIKRWRDKTKYKLILHE